MQPIPLKSPFNARPASSAKAPSWCPVTEENPYRKNPAKESAMKISIQNLQLKYGSFTAIENLNLDIEDGEALVLLGQSGCGKTSTMRCIAGLEEPTSGRIIIDEVVVFDSEKGINLPPNKRNVGMVFQSYAVWPQ